MPSIINAANTYTVIKEAHTDKASAWVSTNITKYELVLLAEDTNHRQVAR
jgi:hypothetical protein